MPFRQKNVTPPVEISDQVTVDVPVLPFNVAGLRQPSYTSKVCNAPVAPTSWAAVGGATLAVATVQVAAPPLARSRVPAATLVAASK